MRADDWISSFDKNPAARLDKVQDVQNSFAARWRGRCGEAGSLAQIRRATPWAPLALMGAGARAHDQGSDQSGDGDPDGLAEWYFGQMSPNNSFKPQPLRGSA